MIEIGVPYITELNDKARIYCDIKINDKNKIIWFEVDKKYKKYLCTERSDAYVVGLLNYALRNGYDIKCLVPITETLLYQIREILIPSLVKHSHNLKYINIIADTAIALHAGTKIGTGLSCGIDSLWSIKAHANSIYANMNIDYLCINNVGAFNDCYKEYGIEKVKKERYKIAEEVAKELGIELIKTNSNFDEIKQEHYLTSSYSCCFAIFMLQKLWKIYYLGSNGIDYANFTLKDNDLFPSEESDLLLLQCFSFDGLKIYCDGGNKSRLEKTQDLVDYNIAKKYLHVCTAKSYNCGKCSKCKRTLLTLDLLDKLDDFSSIFDINYYKSHKISYYNWLIRQHILKDKMNEPVYDAFIKKSMLFKVINFIYIIPNYCIVLLKKLKKKIKFIKNFTITN